MKPDEKCFSEIIMDISKVVRDTGKNQLPVFSKRQKLSQQKFWAKMSTPFLVITQLTSGI